MRAALVAAVLLCGCDDGAPTAAPPLSPASYALYCPGKVPVFIPSLVQPGTWHLACADTAIVDRLYFDGEWTQP